MAARATSNDQMACQGGLQYTGVHHFAWVATTCFTHSLLLVVLLLHIMFHVRTLCSDLYVVGTCTGKKRSPAPGGSDLCMSRCRCLRTCVGA